MPSRVDPNMALVDGVDDKSAAPEREHVPAPAGRGTVDRCDALLTSLHETREGRSLPATEPEDLAGVEALNVKFGDAVTEHGLAPHADQPAR